MTSPLFLGVPATPLDASFVESRFKVSVSVVSFVFEHNRNHYGANNGGDYRLFRGRVPRDVSGPAWILLLPRKSAAAESEDVVQPEKEK
jgi:hypothetical protein